MNKQQPQPRHGNRKETMENWFVKTTAKNNSVLGKLDESNGKPVCITNWNAKAGRKEWKTSSWYKLGRTTAAEEGKKEWKTSLGGKNWNKNSNQEMRKKEWKTGSSRKLGWTACAEVRRKEWKPSLLKKLERETGRKEWKTGLWKCYFSFSEPVSKWNLMINMRISDRDCFQINEKKKERAIIRGLLHSPFGALTSNLIRNFRTSSSDFPLKTLLRLWINVYIHALVPKRIVRLWEN